MVLGLVGWVWKWYGYLLLVALFLSWGALGRGMTLLLLALALVYFTVSAPSVCAAITRRGQLCRNNSRGLMMGCHLREHKWQKWRLLVIPRAWGKLVEWLRRQPKMPIVGALIATVAALATVVQAAAAVIWHP